MTIDKTMRLKEDLKVHAGIGGTVPYDRLNENQKKAYIDYYEKRISKEFDEEHLTGKALVKWKFERYLKDYYATAKSLDRNVGRILDYLDSTGLAKNTVVIYASDQGFYLGEHGWFDKRFIYEESLRTAFLARYPGHIKPGTTVKNLVSNVDWAPTILDLAQAPIPAEIQGRSFLPLLLQTEVSDWRQDVYYHYYKYPQPHHVSPHFGIRTKKYMLARFYKGVESWELFDLEEDPDELRNLSGDKHFSAIERELKERLKKQILLYDDQEALKEFRKAK